MYLFEWRKSSLVDVRRRRRTMPLPHNQTRLCRVYPCSYLPHTTVDPWRPPAAFTGCRHDSVTSPTKSRDSAVAAVGTQDTGLSSDLYTQTTDRRRGSLGDDAVRPSAMNGNVFDSWSADLAPSATPMLCLQLLLGSYLTSPRMFSEPSSAAVSFSLSLSVRPHPLHCYRPLPACHFPP